MKTKTTILFLSVMLLAVCACLAQPVIVLDGASPPGAVLPEPKGTTGLLLLLIPLAVPLLVRIASFSFDKLPDWSLPIVASCMGALIDFLGSVMLGTGASPIFAALMGSAGVGLREMQDQIRKRISRGPVSKLPPPPVTTYTLMVLTLGLGGMLVSAPLVLTGCGSLKPVPVAEGHDVVVVNAERIQKSSLDIYEQVIQWEFANRATLPVGVSRAVDKYRKEFPPAWRQSRVALAQYKVGTGPNASALSKVTTALSIAQSSLLGLMSSGTDAEVTQASNALSSLLASITTLFTPPTPTP